MAFRFLLASPALVVFVVLWFAKLFVTIAAAFAVLLTGRWPAALRGFVEWVWRYTVRFGGYWWLLTDRYPLYTLR